MSDDVMGWTDVTSSGCDNGSSVCQKGMSDDVRRRKDVTSCGCDNGSLIAMEANE